MQSLSTRDFGRCPCSGIYEARMVEVTLSVDGKAVILKRVPQGSCPLCGSRVYKTLTLEAIEQAHNNRPLPHNRTLP
jgi:YgiT-type zinc finger domain-containing protein